MLAPTSKDIKWVQLCLEGAKIFSTCSKRQYFAVVLAPNGRVVGTGFNGVPSGFMHCVDGGCPRAQENSAPGSEYSNCLASHAEENAIVWSDRSAREGGTLVVNGPPCWQCGKLIANSGVKRLVYLADDSYADWAKVRLLMAKAKISIVEVERDLVAGGSIGGLPCGDVGCGSTEEVVVEIQPRQSNAVAADDCDRSALWPAAPLPGYDTRIHPECS